TALVTSAYLGAGTYKVWLLLRGERALMSAQAATPAPLADDELPLYTALVPLHHEGKLLPLLIEQLVALDYPEDKLEVLLLVESDDEETRSSLDACILPPHIRPLTVPPGQPRTKPRALNVGLARARGALIVVYDAEDRPEPDQLRKAAAAFRALPRRVVCLQARLNFYNMRQSALARLFTADYVQWYYMLLPGMVRGARPFVPLGGTSNHFRVEALRRLGGWDPYNVTEDCDLGVRITRAGLHVDALDSTTWEEAVPRAGAWLRQRSRWVKGYLQTYLVHMRHPVTLWRDVGLRGFCDFQSLVGGSSLLLLVNPLMWALLLLYALAHGTALEIGIESLFPPPLYYASLLSFAAGNFLFFYTGLYVCVRHGFDDLTKYALLAPLYWLLMSIGAWAGVVSLVRDPHYWAKTAHGVSLGSTRSVAYRAAARHVLRQTSGIDGINLTIVIPAYNEALRLPASLRRLRSYVDRRAQPTEVIVVDDGSSDETVDVVQEWMRDWPALRLVRGRHQGKGGAIRTGVLEARGEYIALADADFSMPPEEFDRFSADVVGSYDIAIASREGEGAHRFNEPLHRQVMSRVFNALTRSLLVPGIRDTQCGFKCLRREAALDLFAHLTIKGWGFDVELLHIARLRGYRVCEVPITWYFMPGSRIHPVRDTAKMLFGLAAIRLNSWRGRYSDARAQASGDPVFVG
ncbi:MAG TPA: glycosyltransferase, partial [Ktedonobacterales bacterium]|nr:glycosyltransferase [Ktedonobacterales bacterium]